MSAEQEPETFEEWHRWTIRKQQPPGVSPEAWEAILDLPYEPPELPQHLIEWLADHVQTGYEARQREHRERSASADD